MAMPKKYVRMVEGAQREARLAVRLYNDPMETSSLSGYVIHMHVAWLYLLHAILTRDGVDFRYRKRDNPRRLEYVDGEPKCWELARCVKERWPNGDPVRANLEFFIQLRNKVEHRYERDQEALSVAVSGYAHALLLNFENELRTEFGDQNSMGTELRFPLFVGSFTDPGADALLDLRRNLPSPLRKFIADYNRGLSDEVTDDSRFELRLQLVSQIASRGKDALPIQFVHYDTLSDDEKEVVERLGRRGVVATKERKRGIVGHGLLKPGQATSRVAGAIPFIFNQSLFTKAWKATGVRPEAGASSPEVTDERYCFYIELNNGYAYTEAYVRLLVERCSTAEGFRQLLGIEPRKKDRALPSEGQ